MSKAPLTPIAPSDTGTGKQPKKRKTRAAFTSKRWYLALLLALGAHFAAVAWQPWATPAMYLASPQAEVFQLDLFDLDLDALPNKEPGGGSPQAGAQKLAKATAKVAPPPPRKIAPKATLPKAPIKELVHPTQAEPEAETEPELAEAPIDPLLADAFDAPSDFTLPKIRPARTTVASISKPNQLAQTTSGVARKDQNSTHVGNGPGRGGGPGGRGRGNGKRVVKEKFIFGGPEGAFQADVCAIPRGTGTLAQIDECPHLLTFYADRINIRQRHFKEGFPGIEERTEWFAIKYTGAFKVKRSGIHTFRLHSDDGSRLVIDDKLVINNDGNHAPQSRSGQIFLAEGSHQLKLFYFQGPGTLLALQLFVAPPGRHEKTFRPEF